MVFILLLAPWLASTSTLLSQLPPLLRPKRLTTRPLLLLPWSFLRLTDCISREMNVLLFCAEGAKTSKASMSSITMHMLLFWSISDGKRIPSPCHASSVPQADWACHDYQWCGERYRNKWNICWQAHSCSGELEWESYWVIHANDFTTCVFLSWIWSSWLVWMLWLVRNGLVCSI